MATGEGGTSLNGRDGASYRGPGGVLLIAMIVGAQLGLTITLIWLLLSGSCLCGA